MHSTCVVSLHIFWTVQCKHGQSDLTPLSENLKNALNIVFKQVWQCLTFNVCPSITFKKKTGVSCLTRLIFGGPNKKVGRKNSCINFWFFNYRRIRYIIMLTVNKILESWANPRKGLPLNLREIKKRLFVCLPFKIQGVFHIWNFWGRLPFLKCLMSSYIFEIF